MLDALRRHDSDLIVLAGFMNPAYFWFDHDEAEQTGQLVVKYRLPYADVTSLSEDDSRA